MRNTDKIQALAEFLNAMPGEIGGSYNTYQLFDQEFLVLSEDEADGFVIDKFPAEMLDLPNEMLLKFCIEGTTANTLNSLREVENGESGLVCLLRDIDALRETAVDLYGRGKYLAEDGEENEAEPYFIYRLN